MTGASRVTQLQHALHGMDIDGWLVYDFRGLNALAARLLQLGEGILTRRWFLYIPAAGQPTLITHRIEAATWLQVLPDAAVDRRTFASYGELDGLLREALAGARRVAMEYSPLGAIPYVSYVDAGTVERVRACGVEPVSSADLMQHFLTWSAADRDAHEQAVQGVVSAKDAAFQLIDERLREGRTITELEVQRVMTDLLAARGLAFDHPPIVAFGSHASDGHYSPEPRTDRSLAQGDCVLIDVWVGIADRPMADITWVGFAGTPTEEYLKVWAAVRDARDLALRLLTTGAARAGWKVDRAARDLLDARGYGSAFRHRRGHSLGRNAPHGESVNLDDRETHDTRRLLPGLAVTVEPGVYLGHIGIRSEVNVLIIEGGAIVTTPVQREPYRLGLVT